MASSPETHIQSDSTTSPFLFRKPRLSRLEIRRGLFFFFFCMVRHFCAFRSVHLEPEHSNDAPVHESADVSGTPPNTSFFLAGGFLLLTRRRAVAAPARPPVRAAAAANTQSQRLILSRARRSSRRRPHKCHHCRLWPCSPPPESWLACGRPGRGPHASPRLCQGTTPSERLPRVCPPGVTFHRVCVQCCGRRKSPVFVRGHPPYQPPCLTVGLSLLHPQMRTIKAFVASFIR